MSRALVEQVLAAHAKYTIVPNGEKFEDRRRSLLLPVIDALPGGRSRWGVLKKSGGVPSDIIVDLNFDHYDVFSGTDLKDGTSRITANFTNYGDFRRPDRKWRRATVAEALEAGWIEPLDEAPEPKPEPPIQEPEEPTVGLAGRVAALEQKFSRLKAIL